MVGLRAELRFQTVEHEPDWGTLVVSGPVMSFDAFGRRWFEYAATVQIRP